VTANKKGTSGLFTAVKSFVIQAPDVGLIFLNQSKDQHFYSFLQNYFSSRISAAI
jgi:hypothetical protein